MAERVGFEPTLPFRVNTLSKRAPSATRPSLRRKSARDDRSLANDRIARVGWIHADYGLSEMDAYELLSKVAKIHLVEMVDPNYVVIAGIDKRYLPVKR